MGKILKEFKDFAIKGNVIDMSIGIIVGTAFTTIIKSLVDDIIMPPIGKLIGNINFSDFYINLSSTKYNSLTEAKAAGASTINYGLFLNNVITFLIVSIVLFIVIRAINKIKNKNKEEVEIIEVKNTKICKYCKSEINIEAIRCPNCTSDLLQ